MFTVEELDAFIAALEQHDVHLGNLVRVIPGAVATGQLDDFRGRCFLLLAKVRRVQIAERKRLAGEAKAANPIPVE